MEILATYDASPRNSWKPARKNSFIPAAGKLNFERLVIVMNLTGGLLICVEMMDVRVSENQYIHPVNS